MTKKKELLNRVKNEAKKPGQLGKLQRDIKSGKLAVPAMRFESEKIMYALDLCAKKYPRMPIPYTYLCMMVSGLRAVPKADGTKVQDLRRKVSGHNRKMIKVYSRTIISLPKEGAVRASVDGEDVFDHSAIKAGKRAMAAIRTKQEVESLFDLKAIAKNAENAENLEWYKAITPLLDRVSKQAPALPASTTKK